MTILIAKQNQEFFKELEPKLKFVPATTNTSTFEIEENKYNNLVKNLREWGYNTFAIMTVLN